MSYKINCLTIEKKSIQKWGIYKNIIKTLFCRLIILGASTYYTYVVACNIDVNYYSLLLFDVIILIDSLWILIRKKGIDFKWFSPSYLAFSIQAITTLWLNSKTKFEQDDVECKTNFTMPQYIHNSCVMFYLDTCTSIQILLCIYLMIQIVARRYTPVPLKNKDHSVLLISYITAAADIVDFADYHNDPITVNKVQGVDLIWALILISSIQFSFILTARKKINFGNTGLKAFLDFFFGTEVWSIALCFITLELPYLIAKDTRRVYIFYWEYKEAKENHTELPE